MQITFNCREAVKAGILDAIKIINEVCGDEAFYTMPQLPIDVKDGRGVRTYGTCEINRDGIHIRISTHLVNQDEIINTCIHELLHAISPGHGHGGRWLTMANHISEETPYRITRTSHKEVEGRKVKYQIFCSCCGALVGERLRKCKIVEDPTNYRSNCCEAQLTIKKLD